jgi:hypothetical protein
VGVALRTARSEAEVLGEYVSQVSLETSHRTLDMSYAAKARRQQGFAETEVPAHRSTHHQILSQGLASEQVEVELDTSVCESLNISKRLTLRRHGRRGGTIRSGDWRRNRPP